ncbi:MAG: helix-turn-helix transcriptional regulator [Clostridia bacterium]|nr:helix-turn-helix transcriptional regulator [Clostridia bacterium]MBO5315395.1 helix-turn-helix transcriptional regulator [Clostridia bacterium]
MDYCNYKRLKDMREAKGLSQTDIAKVLDTTRQQVSKWETGVQMMGVDKYIKLAKYYGTSVDYLLGLVDVAKHSES